MPTNDIESVIGRSLPSSYKGLLSEIKDFFYISFNELRARYPDSEGVEWFFWGEDRLREKVGVDGAKSRPAWQMLQSFVEIGKCKNGDTDLLMRGFAMAEDNGDYLFMDTLHDWAVYRFMHDSGEVRKVAQTFDDWLSHAKIERT